MARVVTREELDERTRKQREDIEQIERCYARLFETEDGLQILEDLRKVCFVDATTGADALKEGRRQVFLHIVSRLKMTMTDLYLQRDKQPRQSMI